MAASTRRLLGDRFVLRDLGFHEVKGIAEPIAAWAVDGVSASQSRFQAIHATTGLTDLIGREDELAFLLERQRLAWKGIGQIVLISGEPGSVSPVSSRHLKCASLIEFAHALALPMLPLPHQQPALSIHRPTGRNIELKTDNSSEKRLDKLEVYLGKTAPHVRDAAPPIAALLSIPFGDRYPKLTPNPAQQRRRTFAALLDQFESLAHQKPILLLFEDVQWADAASLELVDLTVEQLRQLPVLALFTVPGPKNLSRVGLVYLTSVL